MSVIQVPLASGGRYVVAEAKPEAEPGGAAAPQDVVDKLDGTVERALDTMVTPTAELLLRKLRALSPDGVQVEFGLDVSGRSGMVIASTALEGHFSVTLTWGNAVQGLGQP